MAKRFNSGVQVQLPKTKFDGEETVVIKQASPLDTQSVVGEAIANNIIPILRTNHFLLKKQKKANEITQATFYNQRAEAKQFVRSILARTNKEIWFVDPYFSVVDFIRFFDGARFPQVVNIVASAVHFSAKNKDRLREVTNQNFDAPVKTFSEIEQENLDWVRNIVDNCVITYYIVTGKPCPIHDRYIVTEEKAWQMGSSFNSFGSGMSSISQIIEPTNTKHFLEQITQDRGVELSEWNKKWRKNNSKRLEGKNNE